MLATKFLCVDFQKDFSAEGARCFQKRPCVDFIKTELVPYFRDNGLQLAEIISDYRLPRPGDEFECLVPGTWGYESEIPSDVKAAEVWIKSMNSPVWIREHRGDASRPGGIPYPDPLSFSGWLKRVIGLPQEVEQVILIGLTLDCCVLCTAQELSFRAYPVKFLIEGVDAFSGSPVEKQTLFNSPASNWGQPISWAQAKEALRAGKGGG
jgi:nicotinamidase-related amidase